jgi:membrane AbrB-like protein
LNQGSLPVSPLRLRRTAETLLIAALGGLALEWGGLPAGLVSGSVLAVAAASLAGRPMMVPPGLTTVVLVVVGIALGSIVTPDTLAGLRAYPASIAVLALATFSMLAGTTLYLRGVHGWSGLSALLGASPGALSQVMALSAESDVDVPAITVVQGLRVMILAAGLPVGLAALGLAAPFGGPAAPRPGGPAVEVAILAVVSVAAAAALHRIRFPGGWLFGAMIGSAALHGTGLVGATLPWWVTGPAMVALGAVTGSRFAGTPPRLLARHLAAGLGSFAVSAAIAAAFMAVAIALLGLPPAGVAIGFAPGALDTMMLLALALRLDPVFVGAHHLGRFLLVSLAIPALAAVIVRRDRRGQ